MDPATGRTAWTTVLPAVPARADPGANQQVAGTDGDLWHLLDRIDPSSAPALHISCGTEDVLIDENRAFREAAQRRGLTLTVDFGPGAHDWAYWDARIQDVLDWLPLSG